jgi:hypothetical protein
MPAASGWASWKLGCASRKTRAPRCSGWAGRGGEVARAAQLRLAATRSSGSGARGANAPAVAAPTAPFGSTGGGGAVGAPAPHAPLALERTSGSVLSVTWPRMGRTYRGEVVGTAAKHGVEGVVVHYDDGKRCWHDFGERDGGCTFDVLEPPVHMLDQIRRTSDNRLEGILPAPSTTAASTSSRASTSKRTSRTRRSTSVHGWTVS